MTLADILFTLPAHLGVSENLCLSISPDNKTYKNTFDLDYYDDLDLVVDECLFQNRWPRLSLHTEGQINTDQILFDFMGQIILCITNMYGSREEDFLKN